MKKVLILILVAAGYVSSHAQTTTTTYQVYFKSDQYNLNEEAIKTLNQVVEKVNYYQIKRVSIEAHTDHDASEQYNKVLSRNRANVVTDYLKESGLQDRKLAAVWRGEGKPVASNLTEAGKQLNRRVEITIEYRAYNSIEDVLHELKEDVQTFKLNRTGETKIVGKEGVQVLIPQNAFIDKNGNPVSSEKIEIELEESITPGESFVNLLTTESNGEMLESGGMLRIDAFANGEKLELAKNTKINIDIPNDKLEDGMSLFVGNRDEQGLMTWSITDDKFNSDQEMLQGASLILDKQLLQSFKDASAYQFERKDLTLQMDLPKPPAYPNKPKEPRKPSKPDPNNMAFGIKGWFMSDAKKESLADAKHQILLESYNQRMYKYHQALTKYEESIANYDMSFAEYQSSLETIKLDINQHVSMLEEYYHEMKDKYNQTRLNVAIDYMCNLSDKGNLTTLNPLTKFSRPATAEIQNDIFNQLLSIQERLAFYKYLQYLEPEFIVDGMAKNGKLIAVDAKNKKRRIYAMNRARNDIKPNAKYTEFAEREDIKRMFNKSVAKKMKEDKDAGIFSKDAMDDFYSASTSSLGWINCDKFSTVKKSAMVVVAFAAGVKAKAMLYLDRYKSLLPIRGNKARIPANSKFKAIFMTTVDGKPHLSIKEGIANEKIKVVPDYEAASLTDIQERLAAL